MITETQMSLIAFRPEERLAQDNGRLTPGQVALANESRFNAAFYSEPLTAYAVGWRDPNQLEETLDFLFPCDPHHYWWGTLATKPTNCRGRLSLEQC